MSAKKLSLLFRISLIIVMICGVAICVLWYPFSMFFVGLSELIDLYGPIPLRLWLMLIFFWLVSIPIFLLIIPGWKVSNAIESDEFLTRKVANLIKISSRVIFVDLVVYLIGNIVFLLLKTNVFAIVHLIVFLVGFVVALLLFVLSHFVERAAEFKELSEGTI